MMSEEQSKYLGRCKWCGHDLYRDTEGKVRASGGDPFCGHEVENDQVHPIIRDVLNQFRSIAA